MLKLKLFCLILFSVVLKTAAQDSQASNPTELLLAIQKSKPDTNRISLQLKLAYYYLRVKRMKPGEGKNALDSAIYVLNQASQLTIKLHETDWQYRVMDLLAEYYADTPDPERCKQTYMRMIAYYHQKGNINKEAETLDLLALIYDNTTHKDHLQETISYLQRSRALYLKNNQRVEAAGVLSDIAGLQMSYKQLDLAENELQQVLAEYNAVGYKKLQHTYMLLYDLEYAKGNYYRAMAYCLQGIKNTTAGEDTTFSAYFYHGMADCNYAVKKYKEALEWTRKSLVTGKGKYVGDKYILIQTLIALNKTEDAWKALNVILEGKPPRFLEDKFGLNRTLALYYVKINRNDLAVHYYLKALKIVNGARSFDETYNTLNVMCNNEIAGVYLKANKAAKAAKYINNAASAFKDAKTYDSFDPGFLVVFYDNSYKYDLATGNYRAAVKNLARRVKLQDSLFTEDKDRQLEELDIKYKTDQQEQSIKNLHSLGAAQQSRLQTANLQRNITIVVIVVMILISALFYRNYRQKQFANNIITHKNELLQHLLTEKEWLLKEVHHRVKNNLHTVICLLESQAAYLENDALKAIENSQHRIYAMSLIHQKLYQSDETKTINMSEYISELSKSLEDSFGVSNQIQFKLKIDPVSLDISHAIPLGLIINEAVTNSIKYAFPNNRRGEISILLIDDGGQIMLELSDNGIGMPEIVNEAESGSLGILLMRGLSDDIDADISFKIDNGTKINIKFSRIVLNDKQSAVKLADNKDMHL